MIKIVTYVLISTLLFSCDRIYHSEIKNKTQTEIYLRIQFDRDVLGYDKYTRFLNDFPGFEDVDPPLTVDTTNLVCTYIIPAGSRFPLHSKIGKAPDYTIFKEILILKPDSLHLRSPEEIEEAFIQTDERHWELIIK